MLSPIYKVSFGVLLKCSKANLTPSGEGFAALTSSPPTTISRKSSGWYSSRKLSILNRYLVEIIPIRALRFFSSFSVDNVSGKSWVFTFMCTSASNLYSCRKASSCTGSVIPVRILKDSSNVLPIVRLIASSVTVKYWWRVSTIRKHLTIPRDESASV